MTDTAPPPSPPRRRTAYSATVLFSALAALVLALAVAVEAWRGIAQYRMLGQLSAMQGQTIPQALDTLRLVRNLETLRLEGEKLMAQPPGPQRLQSMYVIDVIVESATRGGDAHGAPVLREAQGLLSTVARQDGPQAAQRQQWARSSLELSRLADRLTAESIEGLTHELAQTHQSIDHGLWQLGASVGLLTASLLGFVLALYVVLIRPLRHIHSALAAIRRGERQHRAPAPARLPTREILSIHNALDELKELMRENETIRADLELSANTDNLTGLFNRRHFMAQAQLALARARRQDHPLTVAIADLDHFKSVNDQLGHAAGDRVLQEVARRIRQTLRQTDIYCRYGGEEFAFVFPDSRIAEASQLAQRLRQAIESPPVALPGGGALAVTISVGLCEVLAQDLDAALNQADQAMYQAKVGGRNRVVQAAAPVPDQASV